MAFGERLDSLDSRIVVIIEVKLKVEVVSLRCLFSVADDPARFLLVSARFHILACPVVSSRARLSCLNLLTLARTQTHKPTHARTHLLADHTRLGAGAILQSTLNPLSRLSPREGRPCCVTREISFARDGYPLPIICPGYPQAA